MRVFSYANGQLPAFRPSDFSNDKYVGISCCKRETGEIVVLMASRSCNPPSYLVVAGSRTMHCLRYRDAQECYRRMSRPPRAAAKPMSLSDPRRAASFPSLRGRAV